MSDVPSTSKKSPKKQVKEKKEEKPNERTFIQLPDNVDEWDKKLVHKFGEILFGGTRGKTLSVDRFVPINPHRFFELITCAARLNYETDFKYDITPDVCQNYLNYYFQLDNPIWEDHFKQFPKMKVGTEPGNFSLKNNPNYERDYKRFVENPFDPPSSDTSEDEADNDDDDDDDEDEEEDEEANLEEDKEEDKEEEMEEDREENKESDAEDEEEDSSSDDADKESSSESSIAESEESQPKVVVPRPRPKQIIGRKSTGGKSIVRELLKRRKAIGSRSVHPGTPSSSRGRGRGRGGGGQRRLTSSLPPLISGKITKRTKP